MIQGNSDHAITTKSLVAMVIRVWIYLEEEVELCGEKEIQWMNELVSYIVKYCHTGKGKK